MPDPVNLATSSSNAWDRADADEYFAPLALQQCGMNGVVPGGSRQRSPCRGSNFTIAHPPLGHRSRQLESKFADVDAYDIGVVHAYRGDTDAALTWLERAYRQHEGSIVALKVDPLVRNLHGLRRYQALLDKMKMPD